VGGGRRIRKTRRTPTALPRKNIAVQSIGKVVASELAIPKRDVKNNVALNAALRPMRSEPEDEKL
jgi:hypothetical protein